MDFKRYSTQSLAQHAFLSPSKYHWVNYDDEKLTRVFYAQAAALRGVRLHELAQRLIKEGVRLPNNDMTLNKYVNDAIGYKLTPEQVLFFSENCYGTADAIGFRKDILRIHDLKTGENEASFTQLLIYAALFCLEYRFKPMDIQTELRIYQNDDVRVMEADPTDIFQIMDRIITADKILAALRQEVPF